METIGPEKLLLEVASILDKLKLPYFITGGFAVSVWGKPRATFDIDIVVALVGPELPDLIRALRKISKAGYVDQDTAREALRIRGEFNFIDPDTGLKVDFWVLGNDERARNTLKRKIIKKINGQNISFISPEDLILSKLLWYKESQSSRHLEDIRTVLKFSKIDRVYLKRQIGISGLEEEFNEVKNIK